MPTRTPVEGTASLALLVKRKLKSGKVLETAYRLVFLESDPEIGFPAWRLFKGNGQHYDVILKPTGPDCSCADFLYRRHNKETFCKHAKALDAVGLLKRNFRK